MLVALISSNIDWPGSKGPTIPGSAPLNTELRGVQLLSVAGYAATLQVSAGGSTWSLAPLISF